MKPIKPRGSHYKRMKETEAQRVHDDMKRKDERAVFPFLFLGILFLGLGIVTLFVSGEPDSSNGSFSRGSGIVRFIIDMFGFIAVKILLLLGGIGFMVKFIIQYKKYHAPSNAE